MTERVTRLDLCIETDQEVEAEELAKLAVQLRLRLMELDIESADPPSAGPAPPDTRAGEILEVGALIVMLIRSPELFTLLIETVQSWISQSHPRSVTLEHDGDKLVVEGITRRDQRALIQEWITRNTDR
jgi:hypothetical protein